MSALQFLAFELIAGAVALVGIMIGLSRFAAHAQRGLDNYVVRHNNSPAMRLHWAEQADAENVNRPDSSDYWRTGATDPDFAEDED